MRTYARVVAAAVALWTGFARAEEAPPLPAQQESRLNVVSINALSLGAFALISGGRWLDLTLSFERPLLSFLSVVTTLSGTAYFAEPGLPIFRSQVTAGLRVYPDTAPCGPWAGARVTYSPADAEPAVG